MFIFDMGQNMVGWVRLKVRAQKGTEVKLRFAEALKEDGTLYLDNIRLAQVTDIYTCKGDETETWEPRFTYHGFRYVEMTGYPGTPDLSAIEGRVVHDDLTRTGTFTCSNETINQIYRNAVAGIRGNYRSFPTDCPQRDEREAWLGDRATGSRGETYIFSIAPLYTKWLTDIRDAQHPNGSIPDVCPAYWPLYKDTIEWAGDNATWSGTYIILPAMLYDQYGDLRIIEQHYPTMKKWVEYMAANYLTDGILERDTYGDWCVPPSDPKIIHTEDPNKITAKAYLGTTFFYYENLLMQRYAKLLGKTDDVKHFATRATVMKEAFARRFFNSNTMTYSNDTATVNVLALAFGLVPQEHEQRVFDNLVAKIEGQHAGHMPCGLVGVQFLMRTLTKYGRGDIAYRFATQRDYPSWGYMISEGATTIWELWNGNTADPAMNSRNHVMLLGDFNIWLHENLAGIGPDPENPGFKHIIMKPRLLGDLKFVEASYECPYGAIKSSCRRDGNRFTWDVQVPPNTQATIHVPTASVISVLESGRPATDVHGLKFLETRDGCAVFTTGSGKYRFESQLY
jgi:alpha-L-rhamnosidase